MRKLTLLLLALLMVGCAAPTPTTVPVAQSAPTATAAIVQPTNITAPKPTDTAVKPSATSVPTATPKPLPTNTAVPKPMPKLGELLEQGGCQLSAAAINDPAKPGQFYKVPDGKKLVAVELIIGNVSAKEVSVNPFYASLLDADGFVYKAELGSTSDKQIETMKLGAGEKARGWVGFALPSNAVPKSVKYDMTGFSGPVLQVGVAK